MSSVTGDRWRLLKHGVSAAACEVFELAQGETTVGRDPDCVLWLRDDSVSKAHARVTLEDDHLTIEDQGSTNGTYINGLRIREPREAKPGDQVHFAGVGFEVTKLGPVSASSTFESPGIESKLAEQIAHRRRAQRELWDAEAFSQALLHSVDEGILTCGAEGEIVSINPAASRLLGISPAEAEGKSLRSFVPQLRWATGDGACAAWYGPTRAVDAAGVEFPIVYRATPISLTDRVLHAVVLRDIREEQAAREQLLAAKAAAEAANEAKGRFLANITHELRTPLTAILGFADSLLEPGQSESEHNAAIDAIRRNGAHLLGLVNDVLDLSKVESGQMQVEMVPMTPAEAVEDVRQMLAQTADKKGLTLDVEIDAQTPLWVLGDPTRLRQILTNLVGNAIKFTSSGGVTVRCAPDQGDDGGPALRVEVVDTGPGMAAETVERLFEPFTQADASTTRRFGGTGLGLTISRQLARQLGGDLAIESELGRGATARLTVAAYPAPGEPPTKGSDTAVVETRLDNARGLLAEDCPDIRRLVTHLLERAGASVQAVEDGAAAVEAARAASESGAPFDFVLLDWQMPVMDGRQAARALRDQGHEGPIVALTANTSSEDQRSCIESGFNSHQPKPINQSDLLTEIARLIGGARSDDDAAPPAQPAKQKAEASQLRSSLDDSDPVVREIVDEFVARLIGEVDRLELALQDNDHQAVQRIAHWLRGSAGTFGFDVFTEPAEQLEEAALDEDAEGERRGVDEVARFAQIVSLSHASDAPEGVSV